ncbi:hypothetical protein DSECCO2_602380 [anaerobic digester metagenome]
MAALREIVGIPGDLLNQASLARREECCNPLTELEVFVVVSDEIKDRQALLPCREAEPPPELLEKDRETLGGTQEEDSVHLRDINTLVVEIDDEDEMDLPGNQSPLDGGTLFLGTSGMEAGRRDTGLLKRCGHILRMLHRCAEPKPDDLLDFSGILLYGADDPVNSLSVSGICLGKASRVITSPPPRHSIKVHDISDAKVVEWCKQFPIDCFRKSDLGGNPVVEVLKDVQPIHPFRRCSEAKEDLRVVVCKQPLVRGRGSVVKLVDDDHIIVVCRCAIGEVSAVQALD